MHKKVDVIPAELKMIGRDKVGIYCRVSSSSSAQLHSLAGQASWLTRYVAGRPDWFLADIFWMLKAGQVLQDVQNTTVCCRTLDAD